MNAHVRFSDAPSAADSAALLELARYIEADCNILVEVESVPAIHGTKVVELAEALTIVGLAVNAVRSLMSVLTYWKSRNPTYSISVTRGEVTVTVEGGTKEDVLDWIRKLSAVKESAKFDITIARLVLQPQMVDRGPPTPHGPTF